MDAKHKVILYLVLIGVGFMLYLSMCSKSPNDQLDMALRELDSAQKHLDSAIVKIDSTRVVIDTMRSNFNSFQTEMNAMRSEVRKLGSNSLKSDKNFRTSISDLKIKNQDVLRQLNAHHDSLPEIKIIN